MRESLLTGCEAVFPPPVSGPGEGFLDFSKGQEKQALMDQARKHYGEIWPCARKSWEECFTVIQGRLCFWFNDRTGSTRLIREAIR